MAIHFVTGRPGAGKGLYTMRLIVEEIRGSNRTIVTNFPILKDKLAEYLHEEYGESFDILTRVILLESKEDITNFYRVRKSNQDGSINLLDVELDSKGKAVSYDIDGAQDGGVFYVLDEVHIVFGARDWQEMGRAVLFYASQHRKLGDDVILISQAPKNVDSQFRSIAQDYTVLRNHGMEKYMFFKQPSMFGRATYLNMPTGSRLDTPLETSYFKLQKEQADCYETARGVGLGPKDGATADKGKDKRKGISIFWIFPAFGLIGFLVYLIPTFFAKKATEAFVGGKDSKSLGEGLMAKANNTNFVDNLGTNRVVVSSSVRRLAATNLVEGTGLGPKSNTVERVTILSYRLIPGKRGFNFTVIAEDGRYFSLEEQTLKSVGAEFVTTEDDEKLYFKNRFNLPSVLRDLERGRSDRAEN
jgi:hypothetical protein